MEDWRIYGSMDIQKSCNGSEDDDDHWYIQGEILTDQQDSQGETPLLKSMDWNYFDKNGFIKYEHDPDGKPSPTNIIGVPHLRKSMPHAEWLKARLLPRDEADIKKGLTKDYARETAALIKAVQKHNKLHPQNKRTIGFSIEGKYLGKSEDGQYWGKVINVVVTPNPVGTQTYAEMAKSHNSNLIKSLMTGDSLTPEKQTGGAAFRKESIDGVKSTTFNQGANNMEFKDRDEAKDYYMGEGLDEDEAMQKAKELFPDKKEKETEAPPEFDELERSMNSFSRSTRHAGNMAKSHEAPTFDDEEITDITEPIYSIRDEVTELSAEIGMLKSELANSLTALAEVTAAQTAALKKSHQTIEALETKLGKMEKSNKALGMQSQDVSFFNLDGEKVADEDEESVKLTKSEIGGLLAKAVTENKISGIEVAQYEAGKPLTDRQKQIVKSMHAARNN